MPSMTASSVLAAGCVAAAAAASARPDATCGMDGICANTVAKEQMLLQLHHGGSEARLVANVSNGMAACCSECGGKYCSPRSGNCYDSKRKSYYESCKDEPKCCEGCGGKGYCSPRSKNCYDTKRKDYYESCMTEPANCCGGCDGEMYCSPQSGNCYDTKRKDYYQMCGEEGSTSAPSTASTTTMEGGMTTTAGAGSATGCCKGCNNGEPFCSPNSNNCYYTKNRDYYQTCVEDASMWSNAPGCCVDCAGKMPYFSPNSKNCYATKAKDYYEACPEVPVDAQKGECKVGGNNWCAAEVPDADFTFKQCPMLGGMRVKLLTYNLFWWNLFGRRGGNGRSAGRLIEGATGDEPFDVTAFQECDDAGRILRDARMSESEYDYVRWGSNTIAYRTTRWERLSYGKGEKFAEDANGRWQRGAHWVRLKEKSTGNTLFVLNHHGPLPVNSGGKCGGEATAYNMLKMADENSEEGDAIILTGDFNADAGSQTVSTLKSYIHLIMSDWVDMIMTNCAGEAVKETKNLGKGGSDHDALMAIVEF